jgi:hypothetical protein
MPMKKPTAAALAAFDAVFPEDDPRAARRKMFGLPAGVVNGNMFLCVYEDGVALRLPAARCAALSGQEGVAPFNPGRGAWKEYVHASAARWADSADLRAWVAESVDYTATLLPK